MKKIAVKRQDNIKFFTKEAEMIHYSKLKLWKENPRIQEEAVPKLAKLFKQHGVQTACIVWHKNMTIYKGNTTFKSLRALNCSHIPVLFRDFTSETAAQAYGIADNKSSEFAEWDEDLLMEIMLSPGMKKFTPVMGFEDTELNGLLLKPDLSKLTNIKESQQGILARINILCQPHMKDRVMEYLDKTVGRKFGDEVAIK